MNIKIDSKTHTYSVNGDIASISVTELLAKHGLAPNYNDVPKSVLKASAKRGTEIHKDLENVLNIAKYEPTTIQGADYNEWVTANVDCGVAEQMLAYDYEGMTICGTADVMGILKDGTYFVADHKTTSSFHKDYVSWQVSILDYFARHLNGENVNGKALNWKGANKFYCFWYKENEPMQVKELDKIPDEEIEKLLYAELHNEKYERKELMVEENICKALEQAELTLMQINEQQKIAEANAKQLRQVLIKQMQEQGIKSWETGVVKVTYVEQQDRVGVDSKKLKEAYPQVYSDCVKITHIDPSVRITIKDNDK